MHSIIGTDHWLGVGAQNVDISKLFPRPEIPLENPAPE